MAKLKWTNRKLINWMDTFLVGSGKRIFEFGSGDSTIWFISKSQFTVSVDCDHESAHPISTIICRRPYNKVIDRFQDNFFDMVFINGDDKKQCFENSIQKVREGGCIVITGPTGFLFNIEGWDKAVIMSSTILTKPRVKV